MKVNGIVKHWRFPEASERELSRSMQQATAKLTARMRDSIRPMKFDAVEEEIDEAESDILDYAKELFGAIIAGLPALAFTIYRFNSKQFLKVANSSGGRGNNYVIMLGLIGAQGNEPWYQENERLWLSMSEKAIEKYYRNVVDDFYGKVRLATIQRKGNDFVNDLAEKRFVVYRNWATNRSDGIVGTWNSRLMRLRLEDAGVNSYIWRGVMDLRERETHVALEGKEIPLNAVHTFPGEEYGCRCWAVPNFKGEQNEIS